MTTSTLSRRGPPLLPLPTAILPKIPRNLSSSSLSATQLLSLLQHLHDLYSDEETIDDEDFSTHDSDSDSDSEEDRDPLGADSQFERSWTKSWGVSLLRRGQEWVEDAQEGTEERQLRLKVIDQAGQLVASLTQTSASGSILRPLSLPTSRLPSPGSHSPPLDLTLNDALPSSLDPTSVGLQSWGSSIILSKMICLEPSEFGVPGKGEEGRRTLELGAGTGLLSLVWKGMSERLGAKGGEVVATDFHEDVLTNLRHNVTLNTPSITPATSPHASPPFLAVDSLRSRRSSSASGFPLASKNPISSLSLSSSSTLPPLRASTPTTTPTPAPPISAHHLDWSAVHSSRQFATAFPSSSNPPTPLNGPDPYQFQAAVPQTPTMPPPFDRPFHTILAADVVYGPDHALWLKSCVEQFLIRPAPPPSDLPPPIVADPPALEHLASSLSLSDDASPTTTNPNPKPPPPPSFHLIVPLRPTHTAAISSITTVFPLASSLPPLAERGGEWRVAIRRTRELGRQRGTGRADEQGYRLFEIGWC